MDTATTRFSQLLMRPAAPRHSSVSWRRIRVVGQLQSAHTSRLEPAAVAVRKQDAIFSGNLEQTRCTRHACRYGIRRDAPVLGANSPPSPRGIWGRKRAAHPTLRTRSTLGTETPRPNMNACGGRG
ncbi:hypothetical protein PMIN01_00075 [Paraphaeosphaeria minitans]|uniref:Uncharacterized protein n=1 Tax=Paraphaeosphaeria minitans TaxID=565426 RepID=A0A9P6GSG7_9PLEO|nr:hypothetical protein PMIN01_00075 [Paraphaeosphaeria minitans]